MGEKTLANVLYEAWCAEKDPAKVWESAARAVRAHVLEEVAQVVEAEADEWDARTDSRFAGAAGHIVPTCKVLARRIRALAKDGAE